MTTDLPPVPPAVVEFAKENNCDDVIIDKYWTTIPYKNYDAVYNARKKGEKNYINAILVNDKEMRFATPDEVLELLEEKPYL